MYVCVHAKITLYAHSRRKGIPKIPIYKKQDTTITYSPIIAFLAKPQTSVISVSFSFFNLYQFSLSHTVFFLLILLFLFLFYLFFTVLQKGFSHFPFLFFQFSFVFHLCSFFFFHCLYLTPLDR